MDSCIIAGTAKRCYCLSMNWDDLRILIAIRDAGSYARAGAQLRIDETTIARRLARLEATLSMKLFDAVDGERRPTPECLSVLQHADEIAKHVRAIDSVAPEGAGITGHIRLATTSTIADEVLAPRAAGLLRDNPGLSLQLSASGQNVSFSRWEADIAIRLKRPPKGNFNITKLGKMRLYYFEPEHQTSDPREQIVCRYPDELDDTPESTYLERNGLKERARLITDGLATIRQMVRTGSAAGILPEYACRDLLEASQLRAVQLPKEREIWLLVQPHLKRDPATRVVVDWVRQSVKEAIG